MVETPLVDAVREYIAANCVRQHMPGHKGSAAALGVFGEWGDLARWDVTEVDGLDDLHAPDGVILRAEQLLAEATGAGAAHMLVGGATVGLLAAIMSVCGPGEKILLPRNAHRSVWNAVALSGAVPVWLPVDMCDAAGGALPLGVSLAAVESALAGDSGIKAAFFVYPSFYGVCVDMPGLLECCRRHGVRTVVDEAHGAHLPFVRPAVAASRLGADLVVDSWHKSMGSLGQTAVFLVNRSDLHPERWLTMLQTSSPSYPLMVSLDAARAEWVQFADGRRESLRRDRESLAQSLAGTEVLRLYQGEGLPNGFIYDDTKALLYSEAGHSGWQVAEALRQVGIEPEFADDRRVLFLLSYADDDDVCRRRAELLRRADGVLRKVLPCASGLPGDLPLPEVSLLPSEALRCPVEWLPLAECGGRVAGGLLTPYPPGIPWLGPGEVISGQIVAAAERLLAGGGRLQGLDAFGRMSVLIR